MKTQQQRDEEAITIFAGILLFLVVIGAGAVVLLVADQLVALHGGLLDVLVYGIVGLAAVSMIGYLYRHRVR
jgi:uncharacterized membrane protein YuzA (DUF378 family)